MSHSRPPPYGVLRSPLPVNRQDWGGDFRDGFLGNVERLLGGTQWLKMGPEMNGRGMHEELREVLGELPASRTTQTGEGGRNANRADVCSDPGRSASPPKESRGRLFSGVAPWAQGRRLIL